MAKEGTIYQSNRKSMLNCPLLCRDALGLEENILEVLILGHFLVEKGMETGKQPKPQASTVLSGSSYSFQSVNHIAHPLGCSLIGVLLVWLLSKIPSQPPDKRNTKFAFKQKRR